MKGTWETTDSGPSGRLVLAVITGLAVVTGAAGAVAEAITALLMWLAVAAGVVTVAAVVTAVWWWRSAPAREARFAAVLAARREAIPIQPRREIEPAAIHYHLHMHGQAENESAAWRPRLR